MLVGQAAQTLIRGHAVAVAVVPAVPEQMACLRQMAAAAAAEFLPVLRDRLLAAQEEAAAVHQALPLLAPLAVVVDLAHERRGQRRQGRGLPTLAVAVVARHTNPQHQGREPLA